MFRKKKEETAVTAVTEVEEVIEEPKEERVERGDKKEQKDQSLFKKIGGFLDTAKGAIPKVTEFYDQWIKPIYDNRVQIKRRLNAISTIISVIFFIIYVPLVLFGKLADGLALGWDVALYVCIGIYAATLAALLAVTFASGRSATTESAKKRKLVYKIVLFIVRIASVAFSITAVAISGQSESTSAFKTIALAVAIISIIFSLLPLVFGSLWEFLKWLISPAKIKRTFSFVALEWLQTISDADKQNKSLRKAMKKYSERINFCMDNYLLPALGKKYIKSLDGEEILKVLDGVPAEDRNIAEWMLKGILSYAEDCGYVDGDPCAELELSGDIEQEAKFQKAAAAGEKKEKGFLSFFKRFKKGGGEEPSEEV